MEVYILDSLLRRTEVFDKFESMIWTERWQGWGDFELDLKSTLENRSQFISGTKLAINESYRVMSVDTVEDKIDDEGKEILSIKGKSLESILEDRVAKDTMNDLTLDPKWILSGLPIAVAKKIFDDICRDGQLSPDDVIPFLMTGSLFPADTIPTSGVPIVWEQAPDSVYNALKAICERYDLGFRLYRNFDTSQLYFDVYSGSDRTTLQTTLAPVVFSVNLDNMHNTTEFNSTQGSKNVAYVFSSVGSVVVYAEGVEPDIEGFDRRVMVVEVGDIQPPEEGATQAEIDAILSEAESRMLQVGAEELTKARAVSLFDGELNQHGEYKYGVDYNLGDVVEMRNKDGNISFKRVTEQIFVSDGEGDRSYPTLSMDMFASVNTWLSWATKSKVWSDFGVTEYWADM